MMVSVYLQDEAPAIGSGMRRVIVEREGTVWVRLICPNRLTTAKIRRREWDRIKKETVKVNRSAIKRNCQAFIEAVDKLALDARSDDPKDVAAHAARVNGLRKRLKRALYAL